MSTVKFVPTGLYKASIREGDTKRIRQRMYLIYNFGKWENPVCSKLLHDARIEHKG